MDEEMRDVDPVSGNEVPPGAKPEEVRDDVPIMASDGEYVLPANVVRYIGLDRIEKMVKQAKKGLEELDAEGRIGGEKPTMDEDLPFSPEELMAVEEAPSPAPAGMAEGGMVANSEMDVDPATGLPRWLLSLQRQNTTQQTPPPATEAPSTTTQTPPSFSQTSSSDRSQAEKDAMKPTGLARPVGEWGVEDYNKYAKFRNSPEAAITQAATSLIPFGGIASSFAKRATERNVTRNLSEMLESGKDLNGKPLSTEQLASLKETYNTVTGQPLSRAGGVTGAVQTVANIVNPRKPTEKQLERNTNRVQGDNFINRAIDLVSGNKKASSEAVPTEEKTSSIIGRKGESSRDRESPARNRTSDKKDGKASASFSKDKSTSSGDKKSSSGNKKK